MEYRIQAEVLSVIKASNEMRKWRITQGLRGMNWYTGCQAR